MMMLIMLNDNEKDNTINLIHDEGYLYDVSIP